MSDIIEGERLLTQEERNIIITNRKNNKLIMRTLLAVLFFLFCMAFVCILLFPPLRKALVPFTLLICFGVGFSIWVNIKMSKLLCLDSVYVREAIFESCNKYHDANFKIKRNGKIELYTHRAQINEKITRGDKVILIPFQKMLLVFLCRSDG